MLTAAAFGAAILWAVDWDDLSGEDDPKHDKSSCIMIGKGLANSHVIGRAELEAQELSSSIRKSWGDKNGNPQYIKCQLGIDPNFI